MKCSRTLTATLRLITEIITKSVEKNNKSVEQKTERGVTLDETERKNYEGFIEVLAQLVKKYGNVILKKK